MPPVMSGAKLGPARIGRGGVDLPDLATACIRRRDNGVRRDHGLAGDGRCPNLKIAGGDDPPRGEPRCEGDYHQREANVEAAPPVRWGGGTPWWAGTLYG